MRKIFFFAGVILIIAACKKEHPKQSEQLFHGTYQTVNHVIPQPVKMYTRNGVILDTSIIKNFLSRCNLLTFPYYNINYWFSFSDTVEYYNPSALKITFGSDDSVSFFNNIGIFYGDTIMQLATGHITYNQAHMIVTQTNTNQIPQPAFQDIFPLKADSKFNAPFVCFPDYSCTDTTVTPGYPNLNSCTYHYCFPIKIDNGELFLSNVFTFFTTNGPTGAAQWQRVFNDYAAPDYSTLEPHDTIVCQTREVKMEQTP